MDEKHGWPGGEGGDGAPGADGGADGGDGDHEGQTWKTPTADCQSTVFVAMVLMLPVMSIHRARVSWNLFMVNDATAIEGSESAKRLGERRKEQGSPASPTYLASSKLGAVQ